MAMVLDTAILIIQSILMIAKKNKNEK